MYGKIRLLSDMQKKNLFDILYKCLDEWDRDDYSSDAPDAPRWQLKICTKWRCLRTVTGSDGAPPYGREIGEALGEVVREGEVYFWGRGES